MTRKNKTYLNNFVTSMLVGVIFTIFTESIVIFTIFAEKSSQVFTLMIRFSTNFINSVPNRCVIHVGGKLVVISI